MSMRIPSGSTDRYIYFVAVDATDLKTRETGLSSFTVRRSRNGGASAAFTTPTINETDVTNMAGVYELLLDEDTTIDSGHDTEEMCLHITHAGMAPVTRAVELYRPKGTEGQTLTVTTGLASINTTTQLTESYAADGVAPTLAQALFLIQQRITEFAISSTTITIKKLDGTTTAATLTMDSATTPTSSTRAT